MNLKIIFVTVLCLVCLSSCTLWKANEWNSHKTVLEVHDEFGVQLSGIKIEAQARHNKLTDELGQATLLFTQSGLHIVTLRSSRTATKQITINIPGDANKIVIVNLKPK